MAALIAGSILRLLYLFGPQGGINSDGAVVYLMARHASHGHFQAFFWTENYGGSLLEDVTGFVFRMTGPRILVLQLVEVAFFLAAVLLMRAVISRIADVRTADIAASVLWLAPLSIISSVQDPGYLNAGLACAFAALLCALTYEDKWWRIGLTGLFLGLCWWTTPLSLLLAWPALAVLWSARRRVTHLTVFVAGLVVGALPWIWRNATTGFSSLNPREAHGTLLVRVQRVISDLLPAVLQPRGTYVRGFSVVAGIVVFGALLTGVVISLRKRQFALAAGFACGVAWPVFLALTGFAIMPSAARYGAFFLPSLALLAGVALRRVSLPVVGAVVLGTVLILGSGLHVAHTNPRHDAAMAEAERYLVSHNRTAIWSTYWVGWVFAAQTQERIVVATTISNRSPANRNIAQRSPTTVLVTTGGSADRKLAALSGGQPVELGRYTLWLWPEAIKLPTLVDG